MRDTRGFTLTELLVTIVIMGVITAIAFPAISNLQEQNKEEAYKQYEKIIKNGAKVYTDDHNDMWTFSRYESTSECRIVKLSALTQYIKKYNKSGVTCDESFVIVKKDTEFNITYNPVVICKKNNNEVYKTESSETCDNTAVITK